MEPRPPPTVGKGIYPRSDLPDERDASVTLAGHPLEVTGGLAQDIKVLLVVGRQDVAKGTARAAATGSSHEANELGQLSSADTRR